MSKKDAQGQKKKKSTKEQKDQKVILKAFQGLRSLQKNKYELLGTLMKRLEIESRHDRLKTRGAMSGMKGRNFQKLKELIDAIVQPSKQTKQVKTQNNLDKSNKSLKSKQKATQFEQQPEQEQYESLVNQEQDPKEEEESIKNVLRFQITAQDIFLREQAYQVLKMVKQQGKNIAEAIKIQVEGKAYSKSQKTMIQGAVLAFDGQNYDQRRNYQEQENMNRRLNTTFRNQEAVGRDFQQKREKSIEILDQLDQQIDQKKRQLFQISQAIKTQKNRFSEFLEFQQIETANLRKQIQDLRKQHLQMENKFDNSYWKLANFQNQKEKLTMRIEELNEQIEQSERTNMFQKRQASRAEQKIKQLQRTFNERNNMFEQTELEKNEKIFELQRKITLKANQLGQKNSLLQQLDFRISEAINTEQIKKSELDRLSKDLIAKQKEQRQNLALYELIRQDISQKQGEMHQKTSKLRDLQQWTVKMSKDQKQILNQYKDILESEKKLNEKINKMTNFIGKLIEKDSLQNEGQF